MVPAAYEQKGESLLSQPCKDLGWCTGVLQKSMTQLSARLLSTGVPFPSFLSLFFFIVLVQEGEDAVQFANRVKAAIAAQGGLVDLIW